MRIHAFEDQRTGKAVQATKQPDGTWQEVELQSGRFVACGRHVTPGRSLPCVRPNAIFCAGVNYADHAKEFGSHQQAHPTIFMKSPASVAADGQTVRLPRFLRSDKVDYEGELAVVIARDCRNISRDLALDYVLGYCCANDVSARDWQKTGAVASGPAGNPSTRSAHWGLASSRRTNSPTRNASTCASVSMASSDRKPGRRRCSSRSLT